ncbi:acyl-phosphate glycerol 3-phosphate acyltransferase [Paramesorhizobium deserti]|uniref:Acyl-phosphate glycerol 3-phosphate acyltransferase n=1 Tax=Paramesorhizobium deserti TaxID=1494590 RepID=A0A135HR10_9HYPH|nr:lysophospholipid acyltransferase family protein [Paramesorhizobium deserti]KXF75641.1 acyl-phosphate glycerol 3-phosphate acyltransferase [Paramesorhizobium deserti]
MTLVRQVATTAIILFARFITAVRGVWQGSEPTFRQRIYFANHTSHGDFILIWTVLPNQLRQMTRPVAGSDYWLKSRVRRFIGCDVFNAVLIDRGQESRKQAPVDIMTEALDTGASLIIFPEGTRNQTDEPLLPFRSGLYHLSKARPGVELVPVWIDNLNRVMPKGEFIPVPLICSVTFGAPMHVGETEDKNDFLARARSALISLSSKSTALST